LRGCHTIPWPKQATSASGRGQKMYTAILIVFSFLSTALMAQSTDAALRSELEAMHSKWFKAYDSGDGATMDQMEMDNLALVMPVGFIWLKTEARAGKQPKLDPQTERTLSDVAVRRFGDVAVLTGIITSRSAKENEKEATTVVFVKNSGRWKIASAQWTPVTAAK
jgi:ketosteroid isomerase-like protein